MINYFNKMGYSIEEIDARLEQLRQDFFYGEDTFFHMNDDNTAYLYDTGNNDVRTEGMSYGMMICVLLDMKKEFDALWSWAKEHMYMTHGENAGFFAWSCSLEGVPNAYGPAPDGEEFFAMSLILASKKWGDGEGIFDYGAQAKMLLHDMITGNTMFNLDNHQILFVPGSDFTDPSYHLPHFYKEYAKFANEEDKEFYLVAEKASREYLVKACHKDTGMNAEYAEFDGSPMSRELPWTNDRHDWFYSDAYRTAANIALDYAINGIDVGQASACTKLQDFLYNDISNNAMHTYELNGEIADWDILHPVGLMATCAQASLASDSVHAREYASLLWNTPLRRGGRRYYDNCLYMFAFLALSGRYVF